VTNSLQMIFAVENYKNGVYPMPNKEDRRTDKESEEYNLKVAQSVYSEFVKGNTYISSDFYSTIRRNREYALGKQSQEIYMDAIYGKESGNTLEAITRNGNTRASTRKAYNNLNFEIQSPMPRVMDSIINKLVELVNRVSVDATDQYSGAERENLKWGTFVDGKYQAQFKQLKLLNAIPVEEQGYTPKNIEELNLYEAEGGFKLAYEETMERLLKYCFEQSNWEENIVENVLRDLVTLGFAVVEDYYDKYSGQVKTRYVDAEYAGVQYTREESNYYPDYGFYVQMIKLSELAQNGIDLDKIKGLVKTYSAEFGNPSLDDWNKMNKSQNTLNYSGLDKWVCPVFVVKWIDIDHTIEREFSNRHGKLRTEKVEAKYKFKKGEKELYTRTKTLREVHWVVGSEIVFDYGRCEFQAIDGMGDPMLPIHMVQVTGRPLVPRVIPSLDQYMNGWMKLQQGLSMAAMNGYAINMDAVSNLKMGDEKLHPKEVLRIWRQTGNLFFKPTDVAGRPNMGQIRPIEQLQGGAGAVIMEAVQVMDISMRQIEELTGINPVAMGATPQQDVGKAVTEYSIMGTNDILKGVLRKANIVKSNVARAMCLRLSHVIGSDKRAYKAYKDVVGETSLEAVKIANGHDVTYGIRTHARPTQEEVNSIREMLAFALKNGRDGKARITEGDYMRFVNMLSSGASLKRIALLLDFALDKAMKREEEKASRRQQENIQGTQALEAQKSQQAQLALTMETQANIALENVKGRNAILEKAVANGIFSPVQALSIIGVQVTPQAAQTTPQPPQQHAKPTGRSRVANRRSRRIRGIFYYYIYSNYICTTKNEETWKVEEYYHKKKRTQ